MREDHERPVAACVVEMRQMLAEVIGRDFMCLYHYGSRVEGGADAESDYDLLCVTRRALGREEINHIIDRSLDIQMDHGVVFDLQFYSEQEMHTCPTACTPLIQHVRESGLIV